MLLFRNGPKESKAVFAWHPVFMDEEKKWAWMRVVNRRRQYWTTPFYPHFRRTDTYSEPTPPTDVEPS